MKKLTDNDLRLQAILDCKKEIAKLLKRYHQERGLSFYEAIAVLDIVKHSMNETAVILDKEN